MQAPCFDVALKEHIELRLIDWDNPGLHLRHFVLVVVYANYLIAHFGKASTRY